MKPALQVFFFAGYRVSRQHSAHQGGNRHQSGAQQKVGVVENQGPGETLGLGLL